jgi:hypothetical protein
MITTANCKGVYRDHTDLLKDGLGHVSPTSFPCLVYLIDMAGPTTVAVCITTKDIATLQQTAQQQAGRKT